MGLGMKMGDIIYFGSQIIRMNLNKKVRVPLTVYISLTNRCNNSCIYCRVHELPQEDTWTTESLKRVVRQMKACGTKRIHFTGGEPMLRENIGALINYAKEMGFFIGMSTNGYKIAEKIKELKGIDIIFLSCDGPSQVHNFLREKNSFKEVISSLEALKNSGICVMTTTVLTN